MQLFHLPHLRIHVYDRDTNVYDVVFLVDPVLDINFVKVAPKMPLCSGTNAPRLFPHSLVDMPRSRDLSPPPYP